MRTPDAITPFLIREMRMGGLDMSTLPAALPAALRGQLQAIGRRMERQAIRAQKRDDKAQAYRVAALSGGGKREVARRLRQMDAGQQLNTLANLVPIIRDQLDIISREMANLESQVRA